MKNIKIAFVVSLLAFVGCNPLGNTIDLKNLKKDVAEIKDKNPKLEKDEIALLNELLMFASGREVYLRDNGGSGDYVIPAKMFENAVSEVFSKFKSKKITFKDLFNQNDIAKSIQKAREEDLNNISKEIDKVCPQLKKEYEDLAFRLNSVADIKLIKIKTTNNLYNNFVEFELRVTNKTSKPINGINFGLNFYDKFGKYIIFKKFNGLQTINTSSILYFHYYEKENPEEYQMFRKKSPNMYNIKTEVVKVNNGGNILPQGDADFFHKLSVQIKKGECPFVEKEHPLKIKQAEIFSQINAEIKEKCPALTIKNELYLKTFQQTPK
jgi:uncharacterized FlaG/YvyC family protein